MTSVFVASCVVEFFAAVHISDKLISLLFAQGAPEGEAAAS